MLSARIISGLAFAVIFLLGLFNPGVYLGPAPDPDGHRALWGVHEAMHFGAPSAGRPLFLSFPWSFPSCCWPMLTGMRCTTPF